MRLNVGMTMVNNINENRCDARTYDFEIAWKAPDRCLTTFEHWLKQAAS